MKFRGREVFEILKAVRELGFSQFRFEQDGILLEVSTQEDGSLITRPEPRVAAPVSLAPQRQASERQEEPTKAAPQQERRLRQESRTGLVAVAAPMAGTVYRSPSPGTPHFVEVGTKVSSNDVVCIVEVMKLFNSVRAGQNGVIAEIVVKNEAMVVPGQPIMWIKPTEPAAA